MDQPKLSQVFLDDKQWRHRLMAYVPDDGFGVEWAAGKGSLTELILEKWDYALAMELDEELCRKLRRNLPNSRVGIIRSDIVSYPLPSSPSAYPLVGNLPYHLTGPLLERITECADTISSFYGLIQWEVANRISASPGESEFRSISLLLRWAFSVELLERVPPSAFSPEPEVDSGWIRLIPKNPSRSVENVKEIIREIFKQPRKTLLNNLADNKAEKNQWRSWMKDRQWKVNRRPHTLTVDEFLEVYDAWEQIK